jgi:hypothetical protein
MPAWSHVQHIQRRRTGEVALHVISIRILMLTVYLGDPSMGRVA